MIPLAFCIDDDSIVLMLNELILYDQSFCKSLLKFDMAEKAIAYFTEQAALPESSQTLPNIIFLDINMPVMDGWEFLDVFTKTFPQFHKSVRFVILSSSINPFDVELANKNPLVINFMPKPIGEFALAELKKQDCISAYF